MLTTRVLPCHGARTYTAGAAPHGYPAETRGDLGHTRYFHHFDGTWQPRLDSQAYAGVKSHINLDAKPTVAQLQYHNYLADEEHGCVDTTAAAFRLFVQLQSFELKPRASLLELLASCESELRKTTERLAALPPPSAPHSRLGLEWTLSGR